MRAKFRALTLNMLKKLQSNRTAFLLIALCLLFIYGCSTGPKRTDTPPAEKPIAAITDISPSDAAEKTRLAYAQFVDVRTTAEYKAGHADRAVNIPLDTLEQNLDRIEKNEPVYMICETGRRSREASEILARNGYTMIYNVTGGTAEWRSKGLPMK